MTTVLHHPAPGLVHGEVTAGYETVRDAFAENFAVRDEVGGACAVYHRGERVVDLWGGIRDQDRGEPWEADTMVVVYSASKGLAAMTMALAHSRSLLDFDEPVAAYWPQFGQEGKERVTVRQLLAHQAGLFALDVPVDRELVADLDRLAEVLARQRPAWEPGLRQGYHAITLGFYENELIRRVDPRHRTLGQFFRDEIATPLGLEAYLRLPAWIPNERLAHLVNPSRLAMLTHFPLRVAIASLRPGSKIRRALAGSELVHDPERIFARELEIPSGGAVTTARGMARAYGEFASGGKALGLLPATLAALAAPAIPPVHGFRDECLGGEVEFSLGFMKSSPTWPFGGPRSYGSPGTGGSLGFADPDAEIGYAYVTNRIGTSLTGDPREIALRDAVYEAIRRTGSR